MTAPAILDVRRVGVAFGGVTALEDVSLVVEHGAIHGLIGPNGAGKTTLLNVICRIVEPSSGEVRVDGEDVRSLPPHALATRGIQRTFQNLVLIEDATVLDNVRIGLHATLRSRLLDELLLVHRRNRRERDATRRARRELERLGLAGREADDIRSLSYGTRKMVELARALASGPRLLLLDEPTAGLNDSEIHELQAKLLAIRAETPISILVITHHIQFLLGMADRITVLDLGRVIASDTPERVQSDPGVIAAYMGSA